MATSYLVYIWNSDGTGNYNTTSGSKEFVINNEMTQGKQFKL